MAVGDAQRASAGAAPKATLRRVREVRRRISAVLDAAPRLRGEAARLAGELAQRRAVESLHRTPLPELKSALGRGIRLNALVQAGFRTVAQVTAAKPHELEAVPGIGAESARQVAAAAHHLAEQVRRDARPRLVPERRDKQQERLLAALAALRCAEDLPALRRAAERFAAQADPLLSQARPAGSRLALLLCGRERRQAALSAVAELDHLLGSSGTASLLKSLEEAERAIDPRRYSGDELWRDYERNAASYNALLSTLAGGEAEESEAAHGFIPGELRQRITAEPLDTRLLTATLRGYQAFGAKYAVHQGRAILGDEMGLGKTVQALAVMAHLAANGQRRFLVVCPASVQVNWLNEISAHTALTPHGLHGPGRDDAARRWLREGGVGVTTFGTLPRLPGVAGAEVALLTVDEAHYVKNPTTRRSKQIAAAVRRAQRVLFLTGTPMENRVEEFRALVGYLRPEVAERLDGSGAVAGARRFRRTVAPVYLRRNQEDVLAELPEKIEVEDWVQPTPADEAVYAAAVRSRDLMRMRRAAYESAKPAKLERLAEIVAEAREDGRKVVVFSFFLDVLEAIRTRIGAAAMGPLTGKVPPAERQRMIGEFDRGERHAVLLAQIEAGGVGLNVQAASVVIIAEPQWKPATEEQAIARAHRMGQVRTVHVHRLLAKDSIDERMREVQEHKSLLFGEFARKSDAKDADESAVDTAEHRPAALDDPAVPLAERVVQAERHRLGLE